MKDEQKKYIDGLVLEYGIKGFWRTKTKYQDYKTEKFKRFLEENENGFENSLPITLAFILLMNSSLFIPFLFTTSSSISGVTSYFPKKIREVNKARPIKNKASPMF